MNLLVTNTQNIQAYSIIRALRPYAKKIVATMSGKNRLAARLSHGANSRLVDRRYYMPNPVSDWQEGRVQKENTRKEEAYIRNILSLCSREKIDTIFPSSDPQVYVFSKNKELFERLGVLVPIPGYETMIIPIDKFRTIRFAEEAGFPCPRTYLPKSEDDLKWIAEELNSPWVIRPRFTVGSRGMNIVNNFPQLLEKTRQIRQRRGMPVIQEYIPGKLMQNFYVILDRNGERKAALCPRILRISHRLHRNTPVACESSISHPYLKDVIRLLKRLGWWGSATVQTKVDARDDTPKLMEINPRLGLHLWYRTELGINSPLICLKIAGGQEVQAVNDIPLGALLLDPIADAMGLGFELFDLLLYKFRIAVLGKKPLDPLNPPMTLRERVNALREDYFSGREKVYNPHFRYFFQDPLASALWCLQVFANLVEVRSNQIGK